MAAPAEARASVTGDAPTLLDDEPPAPRSWGFVLDGDPMPWPRAEFSVRPAAGGKRIPNYVFKPWVHVFTPKAARAHMDALAGAWRAAGHGKFAEHVPLLLFCVFVFDRPGYHYGTGRNASTVKPQYLSRRPGASGSTGKDGKRHGGDVDNCVKLLKDSLSGVAYVDDGDVVKVDAEKLFADQAGVGGAQTLVELRPA